jgi:heme/copper-type cytochrome/quinol oxidase subunit 2
VLLSQSALAMGKGPFPPPGNQWRGTRLADNKPKGILTALINAAIYIITIIIVVFVVVVIIISSMLQTNGCHKSVAEDIKS